VDCGISESGLRAAATKNERARNKAAGRIAGVVEERGKLML
jgi:hypothetical protein